MYGKIMWERRKNKEQKGKQGGEKRKRERRRKNEGTKQRREKRKGKRRKRGEKEEGKKKKGKGKILIVKVSDATDGENITQDIVQVKYRMEINEKIMTHLAKKKKKTTNKLLRNNILEGFSSQTRNFLSQNQEAG